MNATSRSRNLFLRRVLSPASFTVLFAATSLLLSGCGSSDAGGVEKREAALPVNVMTLAPVSSVSQQREFTGTVTASRRTQLAFERSARLMEVLFDEGQTVDKDEVVARLDQRQLKVRLAELESRLLQQNAVLAELEEMLQRNGITQASDLTNE